METREECKHKQERKEHSAVSMWAITIIIPICAITNCERAWPKPPGKLGPSPPAVWGGSPPPSKRARGSVQSRHSPSPFRPSKCLQCASPGTGPGIPSFTKNTTCVSTGNLHSSGEDESYVLNKHRRYSKVTEEAQEIG